MLYTYLIRQWRIIGVYIIWYSTQLWWILIPPPLTCYTSKRIRCMSSNAKKKKKAVSVVILVVVPLHEMRVAKYIVFHKSCKTYIFASICFCICKSIYTLYKTYSFAYAKYIVLRMYMVLHAATACTRFFFLFVCLFRQGHALLRVCLWKGRFVMRNCRCSYTGLV